MRYESPLPTGLPSCGEGSAVTPRSLCCAMRRVGFATDRDPVFRAIHFNWSTVVMTSPQRSQRTSSFSILVTACSLSKTARSNFLDSVMPFLVVQ